MRNKIIPYNPKLKEFARTLRKNSTLAEVLLWQKIKQRSLGVQFHRQVPLLEYIVDFYCHELQVAIEIDGNSHEYRYEQDVKRQGSLEKSGVVFIRFSGNDVKKNMGNVILSLEEIVALRIKDTPKIPSRGQSLGGSKSPKTIVSTLIFDSANNEKTPSFSFPKKEKLKSRKQIETLFATGRSVNHFPLKLIFLKTAFSDGAATKTMVVVPKKNIKSAVKRNRVKRLLREAYRLNRQHTFNNIEGNFALAILYLGKEMPDYQLISHKMVGLLQKFLKKQLDGQAD